MYKLIVDGQESAAADYEADQISEHLQRAVVTLEDGTKQHFVINTEPFTTDPGPKVSIFSSVGNLLWGRHQ